MLIMGKLIISMAIFQSYIELPVQSHIKDIGELENYKITIG